MNMDSEQIIRVTVSGDSMNLPFDSGDYSLREFEWIELGEILSHLEPGQKVTFECVANDTVVKE